MTLPYPGFYVLELETPVPVTGTYDIHLDYTVPDDTGIVLPITMEIRIFMPLTLLWCGT